jgi:hypothetical protein
MHLIVTALGVARATAWTCGVDGEASRGVFCLAQRDRGCVEAGTEMWPWARTAVCRRRALSQSQCHLAALVFGRGFAESNVNAMTMA